jgi:hypothetical protein
LKVSHLQSGKELIQALARLDAALHFLGDLCAARAVQRLALAAKVLVLARNSGVAVAHFAHHLSPHATS